MLRSAIILTGGASARMGRDKASLDWLGPRAIDRVAAIATSIVDGPVFSVGMRDYGIPHLVDAQPLSGPVGGILAGAAVMKARGIALMLVLAVDAPTLRISDISPLLEVGSPGAAYADFYLPMMIDPKAIPADAIAQWPVGRLIERANLAILPCPVGAQERLRGANTEAERTNLLRLLDDDLGA